MEVVEVGVHGAAAVLRAWSLHGLSLHEECGRQAGTAWAADLNWKL